MFDWLQGALQDSSQVITANRRLARVLQEEYAERMLARGDTVWLSPAIRTWQSWLSERLADSIAPADIPTSITPQQSRVLWERCVRREVVDPLVNVGVLARQCRDAWKRMSEWQVSLDDCQSSARNRDQQMFARVASNYQSILDREGWVDDAGLASLVTREILAQRCLLQGNLTLAGFDRLTPQQLALVEAVRMTGLQADSAPDEPVFTRHQQYTAESRDAELRAAGAWARERLQENPTEQIGIVVTQLEQDAARSLRLVKEGLIPGWQNAGALENAIVNLSYGRRLLDYPAVSVGVLALRWLHSNLSTTEVSRLLQTDMLGFATNDDAARAELRLRQQPDQSWTPRQLLEQLTSWYRPKEKPEFLEQIEAIARHRDILPQRRSPAEWVTLFHDVLQELHWPGFAPLGSDEFQLINRWREVLNEVARLDIVSPSMTASEAMSRITAVAAETIYQPESQHAAVQVMGPLEAAGIGFDKLWITGLSDRNWPPPARPIALLSRDLQRDAGMPDATPGDTLEYASRVIRRLASSAGDVVLSYSRTLDDVEQSISELLRGIDAKSVSEPTDPGWHALCHGEEHRLRIETADPVPAVSGTQKIAGGAATIQRQFVDPFAAFCFGRLGIRPIWPIAVGLPANIRGSLIHSALHKLYAECPSRDQIRDWGEQCVDRRVQKALQTAFSSHEKNADAVLRQLLQLEKVRVGKLLHRVVELDAARPFFRIESVEQRLDFSFAGIALRLRIDRVEQGSDTEGTEVEIIDYKTGTPKRLLDRDSNPRDMQLVVYAHAIKQAVARLAVFNIDPRGIAIDAAGREQFPEQEWDAKLAAWKAQVEIAAAQIAAGDVRLARQQSVQAARPLALLSRYRELLHDTGIAE